MECRDFVPKYNTFVSSFYQSPINNHQSPITNLPITNHQSHKSHFRFAHLLNIGYRAIEADLSNLQSISTS
jgi:hypothetical protein